MGILDDAIREHLELKRQHGAESDDLERLEKEAFGAPARPGDPEFATGEASRGRGAGRGAHAADGPPPEPRPSRAEPDADRAAPTTGSPPPTRRPSHRGAPRRDRAAPSRPGSSTRISTTPPITPPPTEAEPAAGRGRARASRQPGPPRSSPPRRAAEAPPEAPERGIFDAAEEFDFDDVRPRARRGGRRNRRPAVGSPGGAAVPRPAAPTARAGDRGAARPLRRGRHRQPAAPVRARARTPARARARTRRRGSARGDARLPPGRPRGRGPLVRAGRAQGLRLRRRATDGRRSRESR